MSAKSRARQAAVRPKGLMFDPSTPLIGSDGKSVKMKDNELFTIGKLACLALDFGQYSTIDAQTAAFMRGRFVRGHKLEMSADRMKVLKAAAETALGKIVGQQSIISAHDYATLLYHADPGALSVEMREELDELYAALGDEAAAPAPPEDEGAPAPVS